MRAMVATIRFDNCGLLWCARLSERTVFFLTFRIRVASNRQNDRYGNSDMRATARVNRQGRIVIPAECRAAAGLKPGDELIVETVGEGQLRLSTARQAIKEAQAIVARYRKKGGDPVQELIEERRAEAARE